MENISPIKPLSDAISAPIVNAYKAGGFGLALVFVGTLLLLSTLFFGGSIIAYIVGMLGALIILTVLYLFYFQSIKPLKDLNDRVQKNQETINTVQQAAIQMTDLAYNLQALAFKHADEVASLITQIRQNTKLISRVVPGFDKIGQIADNKYVVKAEDLSSSIVSLTVSTRLIIEDVKRALVEADPTQLKTYLSKIEELDLKTQELLKASQK